DLLCRPFVLLGASLFRAHPPLRETAESVARWRLAWLFGSWIALSVIWGIGYWIFDFDVYYVPGTLGVCIVVALGVRLLEEVAASLAPPARQIPRDTGVPGSGPAGRIPTGFGAVAAAALLLALLYPVPGRWRENDHHRDWSALRYARALTQAL